MGAALRSVAVLSRGRADAFEGDDRPARDELVELDEYDEPDSDALESDDSVQGMGEISGQFCFLWSKGQTIKYSFKL